MKVFKNNQSDIEISIAYTIVQAYSLGVFIKSKELVPLRPGEKNQKILKIKIMFIVWSQCVLQYFNSYMKKLPMFKIKYLSDYNLSFRVGVLCLH